MTVSTIFGRTKGEVKSLLETHVKNVGLVQDVRGYRSYRSDVSPLLVVSTDGYSYRDADDGEFVHLVIATFVRYDPEEDEEEQAEERLDEIEQKLNELFSPKEGMFSQRPGYWGDTEFPRPSTRPASEQDRRIRSSQKFIRFLVYGV